MRFFYYPLREKGGKGKMESESEREREREKGRVVHMVRLDER